MLGYGGMWSRHLPSLVVLLEAVEHVVGAVDEGVRVVEQLPCA